jgi:hypothetical protein
VLQRLRFEVAHYRRGGSSAAWPPAVAQPAELTVRISAALPVSSPPAARVPDHQRAAAAAEAAFPFGDGDRLSMWGNRENVVAATIDTGSIKSTPERILDVRPWAALRPTPATLRSEDAPNAEQ